MGFVLSSLRRWPAAYFIVLATIAAAFKGVFAKLAYLEGATPLSVLVLRALLAAPLFWWIARRSPPPPGRPGRYDLRWALIGGGLYLASAAADLFAVQQVGAGTSRVLLHVFPLFVLLLEATRDRQRPSTPTLLSFFIGWLGLAVMLWPSGDGLSLYDVGWSMLAATLYALYLHFGERSLRTLGSRRYTAWLHGGMLVILAGTIPLWAQPAAFASTGTAALGWIVALVLLSTVPPVLFMLEGIRRSSAGYAGLLSQVGPLAGLLAAWWLFDESLGIRQLVGAALVLGGVATLRGRPIARPAATAVAGTTATDRSDR